MKIFDCFQFFDEDMMLDLRLNVLNEYVDKFVIVENLFMHSGKKKSQNFKPDNFKKFKDKIIYILVDRLPNDIVDIDKSTYKDKTSIIIDNTLKIEHNQRNKINEGLKEAEENDLILISDVDEIPKLENIKLNLKNKIVLFKQKIYYYKFNLSYSGKTWSGTKGVLKKNLKTPQWLRDIKDKKYPFWRLDILFNKMKYNNIEFINDGGWHFTNFRSPKDLEFKLRNFGHHAEFLESGLSIQDIEKMINENKAIYDYKADMREDKWKGEKKLIKSDNSELPIYVQSNYEKYKSWFI
tara:strand:+ start:1391 stop:2275 length:885 start_codon:yes stop_codon:yes gene_type:complete